MTGTSGCGGGQGLKITPANAWIDHTTNCVGVEGSAYVFADTSGSSINFTSDDAHFCAAGTAVKASLGGWGAAMQIQLNAPTGNPMPYNASQYGVTGLTFDVSGQQIPPLELQFAQDGSGVAYCIQLGTSGYHQANFSDAHPDCAVSGASPDPTRLTLVSFVVYPAPDTDTPFDFCIDNLSAFVP